MSGLFMPPQTGGGLLIPGAVPPEAQQPQGTSCGAPSCNGCGHHGVCPGSLNTTSSGIILDSNIDNAKQFKKDQEGRQGQIIL